MSKGTPFTREIVDRLDDLETDIDTAVADIEAAATDIADVATAVGSMDDAATNSNLSDITTTSAHAKLSRLLTDYTNGRAGYLDELSAANIPADVDTLKTAVGVAGATATADSLADIATTSAHAKLTRLLQRFSANAFSSTVNGAACTDVEAMVSALASYFVAAGAAFSASIGGSARTAIDTALAALDAEIYTSAHTLKTPNTKIGDIARTIDLILGSRWDSTGDLGTDIAAMISETSYNRYGNMLYFDSVQGSAGTAWPIGVAQSPASNVANLQTISTATKIKSVHVRGTMQLGQAWSGYDFHGENIGAVTEILDINGQNVDSTAVHRLLVMGAQGAGAGGSFVLRDAIAISMSNYAGFMRDCSIYSTLGLRDTGYIGLTSCNAAYGAVTITMQAPTWFQAERMVGEYTLDAQDGGTAYFDSLGEIHITNMTAGTLYLVMNGGSLEIAASCIGTGTIVISGHVGSLTNNAGAGTTVTNGLMTSIIPSSANTASWNSTALAAIEGEVEDGLEGKMLDHLLAVTDGASSNLAAANVVDGSIIAKLASKTALGAAPENFNCETDSLEAQADRGIDIKAKTDLILPGTKFATKTSTADLTSGDLFTYTGTVGIISIIGRITTVIENAAVTVKLTITPDALAAKDICAASADIKTFTVGTMLSITGTFADAMVVTTSVGCAPSQASMITATCVTSGKISTVFGPSADNSGVIVWEILWIPQTPGATLVAA